MKHDAEVLIGLGSNLSNPLSQIAAAIKAIKNLPRLHLLAQSHCYQSLPQGPQDQELFCNAVVLVQTDLTPLELLHQLQQIEVTQGRVKLRHWGERIIDLDILFYQDQIFQSQAPDLTIPHPHALSRDFVVIPALEIAPEWQLPDGTRLKDYLRHCLDHRLTLID